MRLTRRTRLACVAMFTALGLTLAACGGGDDGGDATDEVITAYGTTPQNPLITTNTNEVGGGNIIDLLYAGLVSYDVEGNPENEVAESIESEDNKVWTIKLKDWEFSDGTPVTADSFAKAWNHAADPDNAQLAAYFMYPFEGTTDDGTTVEGADTVSGIKVVDEKTLEVTLKEAEALFPLRLGYSAYYPLPESAFGEDGKVTEEFGQAPIGNGPYTLESYDPTTEAVMVPNESYDGLRKAKNSGVTFKMYTDPDGAYSDLQAGNLDVMQTVPPSALATFTEDESIKAYEGNSTSNSTITIPDSLDGMEGEEGQLRRLAISKAINRAEITQAIFEDSRTPATDFSSELMPGYTDDIEGAEEALTFDAAGAQDLWDQANDIAAWDSEFVLSYNSDGPGNKEWVEAVVNQLNNNIEGINASPKAFATFGEFRELVTNRTIGTAFRTGWQPDYPSIYNYLAPIFGTGAGSNDGDYSNQEFDDLLAQSGSAEGEEQFGLFADAQAILFEDLPAIPLWTTRISGGSAEGVENVVFNWQGVPEYQNVTK